MAEETVTSDKGIGLTMVFGAFAVVGAGVLLYASQSVLGALSQSIAAWGFAAAMVAAALSVVAVQMFDV